MQPAPRQRESAHGRRRGYGTQVWHHESASLRRRVRTKGLGRVACCHGARSGTPWRPVLLSGNRAVGLRPSHGGNDRCHRRNRAEHLCPGSGSSALRRGASIGRRSPERHRPERLRLRRGGYRAHRPERLCRVVSSPPSRRSCPERLRGPNGRHRAEGLRCVARRGSCPESLGGPHGCHGRRRAERLRRVARCRSCSEGLCRSNGRYGRHRPERLRRVVGALPLRRHRTVRLRRRHGRTCRGASGSPREELRGLHARARGPRPARHRRSRARGRRRTMRRGHEHVTTARALNGGAPRRQQAGVEDVLHRALRARDLHSTCLPHGPGVGRRAKRRGRPEGLQLGGTHTTDGIHVIPALETALLLASLHEAPRQCAPDAWEQGKLLLGRRVQIQRTPQGQRLSSGRHGAIATGGHTIRTDPH